MAEEGKTELRKVKTEDAAEEGKTEAGMAEEGKTELKKAKTEDDTAAAAPAEGEGEGEGAAETTNPPESEPEIVPTYETEMKHASLNHFKNAMGLFVDNFKLNYAAANFSL